MYENNTEPRGQTDTTPDHEKSEGDQDSEAETEEIEYEYLLGSGRVFRLFPK